MIPFLPELQGVWWTASFSLLAVVFIYILGSYVCWFFRSRSWTQVVATVEELKVTKASWNHERVASIEVRYSYEIQGEIYVGDKVILSDYCWFRAVGPPHRLVREYSRYHEGAKIFVYVDINDPKRSYVEREIDFRMIILTPILFLATLYFIANSI